MNADAMARRERWVTRLAQTDGGFREIAAGMIAELHAEVIRDGVEALLDHLRFCGAVPECYGHDSTAEKLYAKYTDAVLHEALLALGYQSVILEGRGDSADVQARGEGHSLVADAKAFRLSRTAKNQKDFKVQAMDGWRDGLDYALLVCPIYQLPAKSSQIYQQAIARNVCLFSYTHLATLVRLARFSSAVEAGQGLREILASVSLLHPGKSAQGYWAGVNQALLRALGEWGHLWTEEKRATLEALTILKQEAVRHLTEERNRLMALSHQEALAELLQRTGVSTRLAQVMRVAPGDLLESRTP